MTRRGLALLAGLSFAGIRTVDAATLSCAQAAAVAEAGTSLPPGLLLAVGVVESGRPDIAGRRAPWPWTINAAGIGRFFDSAEDAVQAVENLRTSGIQSVDIGCFQINLFHHPAAFATVASGFDPLTNALAAARFLMSLHDEFGDWGPAIAAYHSRTDTRGTPYRERVLAAWHGLPGPRVIAVAGVHVWGPNGALDVDVRPLAAVVPRRLPRVITPTIR